MKNLFIIKIMGILSIVVLPLLVFLSQKDLTAYANTPSYQVTVIASNLNVRENADISSKIIGKVHQGDMLEVIRSKNSWDQIKLSSNQTGWIYNTYVTPNIKATVEAIVLTVRENPSFSRQVIGKLKKGSKITVLKEQAGWAKIESSSGIQGWVYEYFITKDALANDQSQPKTLTSKTTEKKGLSQSTESSHTSDVRMDAQSAKTEFLPNNQDSLKGKTIVLDPGHGGSDGGTTSIVGTHEKALTLATAKLVEQKLKNAGAKVIMTRTDDTYISLQQRTDLSNQNHADAFISFHYNWSNDPSVNGVADFYYQKSKDDSLASAILNDVAKTTGLKTDGTKFDNLDVLRNNLQPSTLIELGFLSNKQDDSLVESSSYLNNVAQGVYLGLLDYFSNNK